MEPEKPPAPRSSLPGASPPCGFRRPAVTWMRCVLARSPEGRRDLAGEGQDGDQDRAPHQGGPVVRPEPEPDVGPSPPPAHQCSQRGGRDGLDGGGPHTRHDQRYRQGISISRSTCPPLRPGPTRRVSASTERTPTYELVRIGGTARKKSATNVGQKPRPRPNLIDRRSEQGQDGERWQSAAEIR